MKKSCLISIVLLVAAAFSPAQAGGRRVNITWSPNSEPDLAGYIFYERIAEDHVVVAVLSPSEAPSCKIKKVIPGTHYYSVTAFNSAGLESDYSAEVVYVAESRRR